MSSLDWQLQSTMKPGDEGSVASLSQPKAKSVEREQQNPRAEVQDGTNSEDICDNYLEQIPHSDWTRTDLNASRSTSEDSGDSASKSRCDCRQKMKDVLLTQETSPSNCVSPGSLNVLKCDDRSADVYAAVKAEGSTVTSRVGSASKDSSTLSFAVGPCSGEPFASSKVPTGGKEAFDGNAKAILTKVGGRFSTGSGKLGTSGGNVSTSGAMAVSSTAVSHRIAPGSWKKNDLKLDCGSHQGDACQKHSLLSNPAQVTKKYHEAKKYSHLCPKLSKVPKVHLKRLFFVKPKLKPVSGVLKKDQTTAGKSGAPKQNVLSKKLHAANFLKPASKATVKKCAPAAGSKISKGVAANTIQTFQVVVVHPKSHRIPTDPKEQVLDEYTELLDRLRQDVPGFETAQTDNLHLPPGEPGMPLKTYCACGMAGSEYATRYNPSPDDARTYDINNVTRVVINGFAFLAFYRQEKLYLSYGELVEMQVLDSVAFTDLLKEYPPTTRNSKCVDIMTSQEFAYLKFRSGAHSSLGLISLGVFRKLVQQGQITWKLFENPKFSCLPLGHLCPKTARDLFFDPHSIFNMDKIAQAPAPCQEDFTMHVGQICFVQNPVWVFECSKMIFINWNQFFLAHQLGSGMLQMASSLLHKLGVVLADAPLAICNAILPKDYDPRKPLSRCSPWVRLRSLGQVLDELSAQPSVVPGSPQHTQVQQMAWLVNELRSQDILWHMEVSFEKGSLIKTQEEEEHF